MKCYNCECNLIIDIDINKNIDTNKIAIKYKHYDLCSSCYDNLVDYGFLGNIENPLITYEKEKINLKKKKK
tara:strand:+ start:153 stop:365 length:213 start_codon:yes stop_codon:yes gene_type:complete